MGNPKLKWTTEEENALLAGIAKHGPGKWKNILTDPDFAPSLTHRSNIDLKDKWRNLSGSNVSQGSEDKRISRLKTVAVLSPTDVQNLAASDGAGDAVKDEPSDSPPNGKIARCDNAMILEALSTIKDPNGCDISAIFHFIEERYEVPPKFRRLISSRLRRLVSQGKLEKVQKCYRIRRDLSSGKLRNPQHLQSSGLTSDNKAENAATVAAYRVAEAEHKSGLADEAVRELERLSAMAEESESMLQLAKEIYEQCKATRIPNLLKFSCTAI